MRKLRPAAAGNPPCDIFLFLKIIYIFTHIFSPERKLFGEEEEL